ncbi:hypothetical protein GBAR_LOCUS905, partial [Geodia barretti]
DVFFIESDEDENNEEEEREGRGGDIQLTHLERAEMNRARVSGHVMSCDVPCDCHVLCSGEDSKETGVWKLSEQTQRLPSGQRSKCTCITFDYRILILRWNLDLPVLSVSMVTQGMTMKIRFMKRLTGADEVSFAPGNGGGKVMFSSCDQVQMKLTQLELNSVRLVSSSNCIGNDLGLSETPPTASVPK